VVDLGCSPGRAGSRRSVLYGRISAGTSSCPRAVLLVSGCRLAPVPGGIVPGAALSARVACTWASARI
jgi:hypothetical protein